MGTDILGRTNRAFPPVWLALSVPTSFESDDWARDLVAAAEAENTVIDISSNPALWGGQMRGTDACLMVTGGTDIERATETSHAGNLIQAHLIQTLSAIGREYIDFYFLRVRRGLEEFQINGALEALEVAKQDGHIRYLGIRCDGPSLAVLGMWQFHDAFEVIAIEDREAYETLAPLARDRRVGVVTYGVGLEGPVLVPVRSPEEVRRAIQGTPLGGAV